MEENLGVHSLGQEAPSLKASVFSRLVGVSLQHWTPYPLEVTIPPWLQAASGVIPVSLEGSLLKTDSDRLRQIADLFADVLGLLVSELATS